MQPGSILRLHVRGAEARCATDEHYPSLPVTQQPSP